MIKKARVGYPVPISIPSNLVQFLDEYEEKAMSQTQGVDSIVLTRSSFRETLKNSTVPRESQRSPKKRIISKQEMEDVLLNSFPNDPACVINNINSLLQSTEILSKKYTEEMENFREEYTSINIKKKGLVKEAVQTALNIEKASNGRFGIQRAISKELSELLGNEDFESLTELQDILVQIGAVKEEIPTHQNIEQEEEEDFFKD